MTFPLAMHTYTHCLTDNYLNFFFFTTTDVVFFDESIDAKMNRYTFKFQILDTPFLNNSDSKHQKTYVAPSPDMNNLPPHEGAYLYEDGCYKLK